MTKAWRYFTGRFGRSAFGAILFFSAAGVAIADTAFSLRIEASEGNNLISQGTVLFTGTINVSGTVNVGDTITFYTSATYAPGGAPPPAFGVLTSPASPILLCSNEAPNGTCAVGPSASINTIGNLLSAGVNPAAGTATLTASGWEFNTLTFGFTSQTNGYYYIETGDAGNPGDFDLHQASLDSGAGTNTARYTSASAQGGNPSVYLNALQEINGGALAKAALLLLCLFMVGTSRSRLQARDNG